MWTVWQDVCLRLHLVQKNRHCNQASLPPHLSSVFLWKPDTETQCRSLCERQLGPGSSKFPRGKQGVLNGCDCPSREENWCVSLGADQYHRVLVLILAHTAWGIPGGASGEEPACQCRRQKRCRFSPWVGKIPWGRARQPAPVFLPWESHGQRGLVGYSQGQNEPDTTDVT